MERERKGRWKVSIKEGTADTLHFKCDFLHGLIMLGLLDFDFDNFSTNRVKLKFVPRDLRSRA